MEKVAACSCCENCEDDENKIGNKIRMIAGAVIFVLSFIFELTGVQFITNFYIKFALYFLSYLLIGIDILLRSAKNIVKGKVFDENFLMSISSIGAFVIGEFPEAVAVMLFYKIGEAFEDSAVNKSRASITNLMDIRPDYANIKRDNGDIEKVSPADAGIGSVIIVKPGEKVPLDGVILDGASSLDVSALTGESMPRDVFTGDEILSGSINKNAVLTVRVTKTESESTVSKILKLVENSSEKKSHIENFITRFARYYTPFVVISALALAVIPPFLGGVLTFEAFSPYIKRAIIFLVVSCPCALVISVPLSFFGGIGAASKNGVLIKGSNYLEVLSRAETIVFDKTGTLTIGKFNVTDIINTGAFSKDDLIYYAAYAENFSNHPVAFSIRSLYAKELDRSIIKDAQEIAGKGVKVNINGKIVLAGNSKLMESESITFDAYAETGTVVYVAIDKQFAGSIIIDDEVKIGAAEAIINLKKAGIKNISMFTGDTKKAAEKIAKQLDIDNVYSELLPQDKAGKLEELIKSSAKNSRTIFVGDGINDAPSLAISDCGIAMGGVGSDAAIEAADVVLMNDELNKIPFAIKIARRTHTIAIQNIVMALSVKGVILIAGCFGSVAIWTAVFGDVGVALIAILNSMRALHPPKSKT
jgi:Cd2+/Zn2+-exporting ATPase